MEKVWWRESFGDARARSFNRVWYGVSPVSVLQCVSAQEKRAKGATQTHSSTWVLLKAVQAVGGKIGQAVAVGPPFGTLSRAGPPGSKQLSEVSSSL